MQQQLRRHEKALKKDTESLALQLEAIYDHFEALEYDEREKDEALSQRFEKEGESLQAALNEMAKLSSRLDASEHSQREAAAAAASSAVALAELSKEVQGLRAHAEASAGAMDKLAASQREAQAAHAEIGVLRGEVSRLQEAAITTSTKVQTLETQGTRQRRSWRA